MSWLSKLQHRPATQVDTSARSGTPPTTLHGNQDDNRILFQTFEWHTTSQPPPPNATHSPASHYARLTRLLPSLAASGVTAIWLPPGCKANSPQGNGYDCYDLWDLGEFDQKWTRSTKWGSREEMADLMGRCRELGLEVVWDSVLNHKTAGDGTQEAWAVEVDGEDRRVEICSPKKIEAWLRYDFPGRENEGMKYSPFKWRADHFNGIDWDQRAQKNAIYKLVDDPATYPKPQQQSDGGGGGSGMNRLARLAGKMKSAPPPRRPGKGWADDVDDMHGNYDYLMFANVDFQHPEVRQDVLKWGEWMVQFTGVDGFRLDAVQHFSYNFTREWIARVRAASQQTRGRKSFVVGEIWTGEVERITKWLDVVGQGAYAYDSPLLYSFSRISEDVHTGSVNADLRTIIRNSLLELRPEAAVTLVANHDTQPGQASFTPMLASLKPLWYAFILLRQEGYPCVFWGDVYGTKGPKAEPPACTVDDGKGWRRSLIPDLMMARRMFAYGEQKDYWDAMSCIAWTREGRPGNDGCVVLISIGPAQDKKGEAKWTVKRMPFGRPGEVYVDLLANVGEKAEVRIDEKGEGLFPCKGMSASVFVRQDAPGIERFPVSFNLDAYGQ
ncbi:hypothetical protein LTS09_002002 [Friedmanniomyces endolithicus]|nr:hypothetical protein LTS09_002002 [Friedmanniomyces endolithicus]